MATNLDDQFQKRDFCSISLRKEVEDFPVICANRRNFLRTGAFPVMGWPPRLFPALLLPFMVAIRPSSQLREPAGADHSAARHP
jgi:hypothetical protein